MSRNRQPMRQDHASFIFGQDDLILVTGATGFIGSRLTECLLNFGFRRVRCFARPASRTSQIEAIARHHPKAHVELVTGNLLSREDCEMAAKEAALIFHLAAGTGQKSFPDAFMNSVVTTRNLLEACTRGELPRRFVNVSSLAVYSNKGRHSRLLDESCPVAEHPERRFEAYCFAKIWQERIVEAHCKRFALPYVIVRPGQVYGPGTSILAGGRVGIDTFGIFLHLGGSNTIPITHVDNCAEAIALAGLRAGTDADVFNVVDDDLPSSRQFLKLYKKNVRSFSSLYIPRWLSYVLCYLWEKYSVWSEGLLPPAFNRERWNAYWKKTRFSNQHLKSRLGWKQRVPTTEGLQTYFEALRNEKHA